MPRATELSSVSASTDDSIVAYVRAEYGSVLDAVEDAADRAVATWPTPTVADGGRVRSSLRRAMAEHDLHEQLPALLETVVGRLGATMRTTPVPAPPYVVVTSEAVLLRATTDRGRILVALRVFERGADGYERRDGVAVSVTVQ